MVIKILEEIKELLPSDAKISSILFEGANIVLYTKNRDFFLKGGSTVKEIVGSIKKRVELRPDPSLCLDIEKAEKKIKEIIPKEAGKIELNFDIPRSVVVIEAEKPGLAIGKAGALLKEIKKQTFFVPTVQRIPALASKIVENIRRVLYESSDERKKFLNTVGERIYGPKKKDRPTKWIRIVFLGAARQVGRSCFLLQTEESNVLLDCGINVAASGEDAHPFFNAPEFNINDLDAVIISHSHLDHVGLLPLLFKYGYRGPVYMTAPTRDVSSLLLLDLISVGQKDAKASLFTSTEVKEMVKHVITLDYEEVTDVTPDVRLTFYNAGHILGSAMCHLHIGEGLHNLLYTGDMNYELTNLLAPAVTKFPRLETVMIESTYGGKDNVQASRTECEDYLINVINTTIKRGGKVLLPVLGVGRAQEIQIILERVMREGKIEQVPFFLQGMVRDVTAIHTAYPDFFNNKIKQAVFHKGENPFLSKIFKQVGSRKEMMQVIEETGPCIIMATSGMMTGGASVDYFKHLADDAKNSMVLTCYQGPGSLGKKLQDGEKEIMFQEGNKQVPINVKMDIHTIHGFTGHSDRKQLINFIGSLSPKPKKMIAVHGEQSRSLDFASSVHKMFRMETTVPKNLESIRLR
jgi:KH/beta-lactamase-domain protein